MAAITPQTAEAIAQTWSRIDWDNLMIRINEEVKAIGIRQDDSDEGKRRLLDESAAFRENTDKALRKAALPLIKAFQAEVDHLSIRSKAAESVVIDLCRALTQVPDPSRYLEQLESLLVKAQRLHTCEEQVALLKSQVADLHAEYADLQNQELTVRKLRSQVQSLESEVENKVQAVLSDTEKELQVKIETMKQEMDDRHEEVVAENRKLASTIADLEFKNRETSRSLEEARIKLEHKEAIEDEQLTIVSSDLDNALRRAEEAEREVARLRDELEKISGNGGNTQDGTAGESALVRSRDIQIRKLLEENKALASKLSEEATESRIRIDELTQELERHAELVDRLETRLQAQADYEDIKKELRILRSVEFGEDSNWSSNSTNAVDNGVTSSATATVEVHAGGRLKALDELLVEKNRKLQSENVSLRMRNQEIQEHLKRMESSRDEFAAEAERQRGLVTRLESDLLSMHAVAPRSRADGADAEEDIDLNEESSTMELLARELSGVEKSARQGDAFRAGGVLAIVTAQRDRLRDRVEKLEKDLCMQKEQNALLQSEAERAREDNVQLYGKIRFLQSYQNRKPQQPMPVKVEMGDVETRYENEYEQHLDPFRKFNMQERQRKYAQLRTHDKAALGLGRWMMSSARSRAIFFFYLLFLHLLVFLVLYRFAYTESCQRDFQADCIANFQKHMHKYHPGETRGHG